MMNNVNIQAYYELRYSVLNAKVKSIGSHDFLLSIYAMKQRLLAISKQAEYRTLVLEAIADFMCSALNPFLCKWHPIFFETSGITKNPEFNIEEKSEWDKSLHEFILEGQMLTEKVIELLK